MDIGLGPIVATSTDTPPSETTLESRFVDLDKPVLLTGIQALLRAAAGAARLDQAAGLNTGGFVSGYRGSPLGGLDRELWAPEEADGGARHPLRARRQRRPRRHHDVRHAGARRLPRQAGRWRVRHVVRQGTRRRPRRRRAALRQHGRHRTRTAACWRCPATTTARIPPPIRTRPNTSSRSVFIPVLNPASVQDVLDLGLAGWALSRFSGLWVAMKTTAETMEQAATADRPLRPRFRHPGLRRCRRTG